MSNASAVRCLLIAFSLFPAMASSQALPWLDGPAQSLSAAPAPAMAEAQPAIASTPPSVTVPEGTHVMMALRSPIDTTSATPGSSIYLETLFPVIQDNRVIIPAHTLVQGVVKSERRAGHFKRVAQFRFHFTAMIFANNFVLPIDGGLQSIPGSRLVRITGKEDALKTVDQTEKVLAPAMGVAVAGAILGSNTHFGIGKFIGAGLGAGLGLGNALLVRGDNINLRPGVNVEMVLRRPVELPSEQAAFNAQHIPPPQPAIPFVDPDEDSRAVDHRQKNKTRGFPGVLFPGMF